MQKLHPTIIDLLAEIEAYRKRAGINRTAFGHLVMRDGNFISRLESGRNPRFVTIERVRDYINRKTRAVRR